MNFEELNAILMITLNLMELRRSDLHSSSVICFLKLIFTFYMFLLK